MTPPAPALPLSEIRMRDPFIIETEPGTFVLFGTTDENVWGGPATGFDCYTSTDLERWQGPVAAFRPPAGFWSDTQYWAPEVFRLDGRFYLFATFASSETRVRGVAVLVSEQATGPYLPWSDGPVTPQEFPCLDGTLFIDDAAEPWLVFSRGAEGGPAGAAGIADGEMYAQRMSADLRESLGSPELLFRASAAAWSRPLTFPEGVEPPAQLRLAKDPLFTDGPFLLRSPAGRLQMLWSSFGEQGYAMGVATSESGTVLGPWSQEPEPLWPVNGGHGMILTPSAGGSRLVFHSPNDSPAERVTLVPVAFSADDLRLADCG
ncbi:glycoside hydrolase family 43 protein [Microterricola viridarii]|nr:glycoside hydrolase family 43 protein [Microterricola viridarii]